MIVVFTDTYLISFLRSLLTTWLTLKSHPFPNSLTFLTCHYLTKPSPSSSPPSLPLTLSQFSALMNCKTLEPFLHVAILRTFRNVPYPLIIPPPPLIPFPAFLLLSRLSPHFPVSPPPFLHFSNRVYYEHVLMLIYALLM